MARKKSAADKSEKVVKTLFDAAGGDEDDTEQVDAQMAADFAALAALPDVRTVPPSQVDILQTGGDDIKNTSPSVLLDPAAGVGPVAAETGALINAPAGAGLPLSGSVSRVVQAEQAATDKAARRKLVADKKTLERAEKAAAQRIQTAKAAADAAKAKADAARAAADAARAAADAARATSAALILPPQGPASQPNLADGGGPALSEFQLGTQFAAQIEQSLVGSCVAAIRRAITEAQPQVETGKMVQALISGLEAGSTFATFTAATDDIVVELQRLAEIAEASTPLQAPTNLKALGDYIQAQLSDVPTQLGRIEAQLKEVRDRQETLLAGQVEAAANQCTMFDRILDAIANIEQSGKISAIAPGGGAAPAFADTALGRLTSYGLGEGAPAIKRPLDTGLINDWQRPTKQGRHTPGIDIGVPKDPARLGRHQVTDTARLICMAAATLDKFFPLQSNLLDALADAGVEAAMTTVGGDILKECIAVNPGPRCRTWRLVVADHAAKFSMMRRFQQLKVKLFEAGLEASDWTWGTNRK